MTKVITFKSILAEVKKLDAEDVRDALMSDLSFDAEFEREGSALRMDFRGASVWIYPSGEIASIKDLPGKAQKEVKAIIKKLQQG